MRRPDFLFVGPDKTGSSWMFHILGHHPDCYVPPAKDVYFFDRYYHRGMAWYLRHFETAADAVAVGELSHDYLLSSEAAARIRRDLPNVKILICLRNPVERSVSHYHYLRRSGEVGEDFQAALHARPGIVANSRYLGHISTYLALFPRDQIKILLFDDLAADPAAFGREILAFLGLRQDVDLPYQDRIREAAMPRNRMIARFLKRGAMAARAVGLGTLVGRVKHAPAARLAYRDFKPGEKLVLSDAERADLWQVFAPEQQALSLIVGRDLSGWAPRQQEVN